jgi:hypothetical protein
MVGQENGFRNILWLYWRAYGGLNKILTTPYFYISVALTAIVNQSWLAPLWWDTVTSVLPNIIGFSMGGYAIWLGWGDDKFKAIISGTTAHESECDGGVVDFSPYMEVSATFVHFILVQLVALFVALLAKGLFFLPDSGSWIYSLVNKKWLGPLTVVGWATGYWLFLYALTTAVASMLALFRITHWFDTYQTRSRGARQRQQQDVIPGSDPSALSPERSERLPDHEQY